jgi:transcriptional regulator with PAS, ATPase and Fis domain
MLVQWFLDKYSLEHRIQVTPPAMNCLLQYEWPGNVRELENCIERAVALGNRERIDIEDLPPAVRAVEGHTQLAFPQGSSATDLEELEKETIQRVFDQVNGDKELAGKLLGISRATLYRKIKRYNISAGVKSRPAAAHA